MKVLMPLVHCSIACITLIVFFIASNVIFPYPDIPNNSDITSLKLRYFAEHKDEYSTIFLGPSSTYRNIVPTVFDALVVDQDWKSKSFNLGIGGATAADTDFYLRKILDLKPANLQWVFIDYRDNAFDRLENADSVRSIYWHTLRQTLLDFRLILESKADLTDKLAAAYANFKSFFYRVFWIGRWSDFWQEKILELDQTQLSENESIDPLVLAQESGYYSLDWRQTVSAKNRHQEFLNNPDKYYRRLKYQRQKTDTPTDSRYYSMKVLENMCNEIQNYGAEPILLVPPILQFEDITSIHLNQQIDRSTPLFAFNQPETYPGLYQLDHRFDFGHLNDQGAREFTQYLAEQFIHYLESQSLALELTHIFDI